MDEATLALRQLIPGENKDIAVVRVSPRDATSVCDERKGKVKLAGTAIHHFGGFFRPDWRRNDIMWGRLDAAERLIGMLVDDAAAADTIDPIDRQGRVHPRRARSDHHRSPRGRRSTAHSST